MRREGAKKKKRKRRKRIDNKWRRLKEMRIREENKVEKE